MEIRTERDSDIQKIHGLTADAFALMPISDGNVHYEDFPDKLVQWVSFDDQAPEGFLVFSPAFSN